MLLSAGWLLSAHTPALAQGWDCQKNAEGIWQCNAGGSTTPAMADEAVQPLAPSEPAVTAAPASQEPSPAAEQPSLAPVAASPVATAPAVSTAPQSETAAQSSDNAPSGAIRDPINDWVALDQLTPAQRAQRKAHCCGAYVEPAPEGDDAQLSPEQAPLRAKARSTALTGQSTVEMAGDVSVRQGWRQVKAGKAVLNREESTLELADGVEIREPGVALVGERAVLRSKQHKAEVHDARFLFYKANARGTAKEIERRGNATLFDRATFTVCPPEDNAWQVRAKKLRLEHEEGFGTAKGAILDVKDVPVAYVPYLKFPIDDRRHTGLLWPSISNTSDGGLDVTAPIYLNLAPNYDATVSPRHIADRGEMVEIETRYLNTLDEWTVSGAYLSNDEQTDSNRWLASVHENGNLGGGWSSNINYTRVSDYDYMDDLGASSLSAQRDTHLVQEGRLSWGDDDWSFSALASQYQTLDQEVTKPYKTLPQLSLLKREGQPFELSPLLEAQVSKFDSPDNVRVEGERSYVAPGISYPMQWRWAHLTPSAKLRHVSYQLNEGVNVTSSDTPSATSPSYSLDGGLQFERQTRFAGSGYTQTLEPRLFYLNSEYDRQDDLPLFDTSLLNFSYDQLFNDTRFTGKDRLDDADQLTIGATTRFLADRNGQERLSASLGQIFYFEDRQVTIENEQQPEDPEASSSEMAGELNYLLNRDLRATTTMLWDPSRDQVNEGGVGLRYRNADNTLLNAGYRYRREQSILDEYGRLLDYRDISQTDFSGAVPLNADWTGLFRWNYDLETDQAVEELVGVEYHSCCWRARLVYQRGWEPGTLDGTEQGVFLQVQLIGLGGIGGQVDDILDDSIIGYRQREDNAL